MRRLFQLWHHGLAFAAFLADIVRNRRLIIELSKKDFQVRYMGSYLGFLWAFIQPLVTVLIFWFVFEVGFKSKPMANCPFILWLVTGMIPWFFISDSILSATTSVVDNSYLVKKVVFRVSLLPIIKIVSALVIHLFFIAMLFAMYWGYGYGVGIYSLQIVYYLFATVCLVLGISWITSALIVFLKDVGQVVSMLMQFGFWMTPVFWSFDMVPIEYKRILALNPAYYLIEGYRNSLIYQRWFWEDGGLMLYYWSVTGVIFIVGAVTFRKLRTHFADVI